MASVCTAVNPSRSEPPTNTANPVSRRLYPEFAAGGFARSDQFVIFFTRVRALLEAHMTVMDFGAGRGRRGTDLSGFQARHVNLRGDCARVIGVDVDPIVNENPTIDEARVFDVGQPLPVDAASVDLVVSCAVFEHVADAEYYAGELDRVLKPGGWVCAFTPNKWGYVGIGARLVPNVLHSRLLKFFIPEKQEQDTFPTTYRMNSMRDLKRLFPVERYRHASYTLTGPPGYHGNRMILARFWMLYNWLMPPAFRQSLHVFVQKR